MDEDVTSQGHHNLGEEHTNNESHRIEPADISEEKGDNERERSKADIEEQVTFHRHQQSRTSKLGGNQWKGARRDNSGTL